MMSVYNYMASVWLNRFSCIYVISSNGSNGSNRGNCWPYKFGRDPLYWSNDVGCCVSTFGIVMYMSFGIRGMSASRAQTMFWIFAFLMGLSLSTIFQLTPVSIARVFLLQQVPWSNEYIWNTTEI